MSGVRALGYIVVQGPVGEWKSFGIDLLGAQVARHTAGEVRLRTDERAWRIAVEAGPAAGPASLVALGFEAEGQSALAPRALGSRSRGRGGVSPGRDATAAWGQG